MAMKNGFMFRQRIMQENNCSVDFEEEDNVMLTVDSGNNNDHPPSTIENELPSTGNDERIGVKNKKKAGRPPVQKNNITRSWTDEETRTLIDLWSSHENLFNTKHRNYYNRDLRQKSLNLIENSLLASGIEVNSKQISKKLTDLKNYYGGQRRMVEGSKTSGAGSDELYFSQWKFFESLQFLNDAFTPRKTTSTAIDDEEADSPYVGTKPPSSKAAKKTVVAQHDELNRVMASAATALESIITTAKAPSTIVKEDDADDTFGKLLVSQIKQIPECDLKDDLKITLQQTIIRCKRQVNAARQAQHVPQQSQFSLQPSSSLPSAISSPTGSVSSYNGY